MSVTSGFFNSVSGDRRYSAEQFSAIFDGIISNGVFASVGGRFAVAPAGVPNKMIVSTGRAWFNGVWINNDAALTLDLTEPSVIFDRYDAVVIEVNKDEAVREATIKVVTGTAGSTPAKPTLTNNGTIAQYPIAYVKRIVNVSTVAASNIEYVVGTAQCPYVTGPLEVVSMEAYIAQWRGQFNDWLDSVQEALSDDAEAAIAVRLTNLETQHPYWTLASPITRRNTFRGQNLGSTVTSEQLNAIKLGTFTGLWLGDYWEIGGVKWRIVDFDYWYGVGETNAKCLKHHIVIMPDTTLGTTHMNATATTAGGYVSSWMNMGALTETYDTLGARAKINAAFGSTNLIKHRDYFSTTVTNGCVSDGGWYDYDVDLPNEIMIYGSFVHTPTNNGTTITGGDGSLAIKNFTTAKTQLALCRIAPEFIRSDGTYWLRDVVSDTHFASCQHTGLASYTNAMQQLGVRPVFAIGPTT